MNEFPESLNRKKEFPFQEGLSEILKKISEILKTKDIVVVAFSASATNVGKSTLAKSISGELHKKNMFSFSKHTIQDLTHEEIRFAEEVMSRSSSKKAIIIFDQGSCGPFYSSTDRERVQHDEKVKEKLANTKLAATKVDLWVGISSTAQPFDEKERPLADILIKNELAQIKRL